MMDETLSRRRLIGAMAAGAAGVWERVSITADPRSAPQPRPA